MCTVSVIPLEDGGVRVLCSRDEQRSRALAEPPAERACGDRLAVFPRDPDGGGTWVGANDAGLACTVLNRADAASSADSKTGRDFASRGEIVPELLQAASLDDAVRLAEAIDPERYRSFRLMVVGGGEAALLRADDGAVRVVWRAPIGEPRMETSSGLGDHLVEGPRQELFDEMVLGAFRDGMAGDGLVRVQDSFHRHRWADRPELSVDMSREDAETVSLTTVEVTAGSVVVRYLDGHPRDEANARSVSHTLRVIEPVSR